MNAICELDYERRGAPTTLLFTTISVLEYLLFTTASILLCWLFFFSTSPKDQTNPSVFHCPYARVLRENFVCESYTWSDSSVYSPMLCSKNLPPIRCESCGMVDKIYPASAKLLYHDRKSWVGWMLCKWSDQCTEFTNGLVVDCTQTCNCEWNYTLKAAPVNCTVVCDRSLVYKLSSWKCKTGSCDMNRENIFSFSLWTAEGIETQTLHFDKWSV